MASTQQTPRNPEAPIELGRQAVGLRLVAGNEGQRIGCRPSDLDEVFDLESGTTFNGVLELLTQLGIVEQIADSPGQVTKLSSLLRPSALLEEGQLGWHLNRLEQLEYPVHSISGLLGLKRELDRITEKTGATSQLGSHSFEFDPRNASILVSVNGRVMHRHEAKLPVFDSATIVGDGLWESFRVKDGTILFFDEHMDRLEATARGIGLTLDNDRKGYFEMIADTLRANGMIDDTHIRFIITAGDKFTPLQGHSVNYGPQNVVIIPEFKAHGEPKPIRATRGPHIRADSSTLHPGLHLLSKGGDIQAWLFADAAGYDEELMGDGKGNFTAFNSTSFFLIKGDTVLAPEDSQLLRGVTRANVLRVCEAQGIKVQQKNISQMDLLEATACFATGTAGGVVPVECIDAISFETKSPLIKQIQDGYEALVAEEARKPGRSIVTATPTNKETETLKSLKDELLESVDVVRTLLTHSRRANSLALSKDSLTQFDTAYDSIRALSQKMNHVVPLPSALGEALHAKYRAGTEELRFARQVSFSDRISLALRAELVERLKELDLLPERESKSVQLWSPPRTMSTAVMHCFDKRSDTRVFDEVLYSCYFHAVANSERIKHPGYDEVMGALEPDGQKVIDNLMLAPHSVPVAFFKQMTKHLFDAKLDRGFLRSTTNILLVRPPKDTITSFAKDMQEGGTVNPKDFGYEEQRILFDEITTAGGTPIVLDSELLLRDPEGVLQELCTRLEIPFEEEMLSWPSGGNPHDGTWARYWYRGVSNSTGFSEYRGHEPPAKLNSLIEECEQHYAPLRAVAIGA